MVSDGDIVARYEPIAGREKIKIFVACESLNDNMPSRIRSLCQTAGVNGGRRAILQKADHY